MLKRYKNHLTMFSFILGTVLLNGCGFTLRGNYLLAPNLQTLFVSSVDPHGELTRLVKQHLQINHVKLLKHPTKNTPELRILADKLNRRTLSLFDNGQVAEYEIIYTVNYQLALPEQETQHYHFELTRDYQDDPDNALAKSRALSLMLNEMRREAADRILRNMATIRF